MEDYRNATVVRLGTTTPKLVKIEVGLRITTRDYVLKNLQNNEYIQNNFDLKIKRLNRWYYSVYFDKKEN